MQILTAESTSDRVPWSTIRDRFEHVDFDGLIYQLDTVLQEFAYAINEPVTDVHVTGVIVVGSVLTTEFTPYESDLDVYIITNTPFEYDDGFRRTVLDTHSAYREWIGSTIEDTFSYVDYLGSVTRDSYPSRIRDPYVVIDRD